MKMNKNFIIMLTLIFTVLFSFSFIACNSGEEIKNGDINEDAHIVLSHHNITLEKLEQFILVATTQNDSQNLTWVSTNPEVASIENGTIKALSAGNAIIKCKTSDSEDKCLVTVKDNKLTLSLATNVNSDSLNLLKADCFVVEHSVTYNNKIVDAIVDFKVIQSSEIVHLDENKILANENGQAQVIISAEWQGLSVREVFEVNVVDNITAKLYDDAYLIMCNDKSGGVNEIKIEPELYENDYMLGTDEYSIVSIEYDKSIIDFNQEKNIIKALSKGSTQLEVTFKSLNTSNTVVSVLPIRVDLYNQDRYSLIQLPDAYINEEKYELHLSEVFADLSTSNLNGLNIVNVEDITNSMAIKLKVENGVVDISDFEEKGILGERRWRVETEKYSYDVKIFVEKFNYAKPLIGKYISNNWDYGINVKFNDRQRTFDLFDVKTNQTMESGKYELDVWDNYSGRISFTLNKSFAGQKEISGYYWLSSGKMFMDLNIYQVGGYVGLYAKTGAPYQEVSGVYNNDLNWLVDIQLNSDETCVFDCNNEISKKCNGTYELIPVGPYNGKIILEIEEPFNGQTVFEGSYNLINGIYCLDIYIETLNRVQKLYQTNVEASIYDSFAGYYSGSSVNEAGKTSSWLPIKLAKDGVLIFDYMKWGGNVNTTGTYKLIGDVYSGSIVININKAYSGNKQFIGTYELIGGRYVFSVSIPGSGSVNGVITYKQDI